MNRWEDIKFWAHFYYSLGFNVSCINGYKTEFNSYDEFHLKAPNHEWLYLTIRRQSLEELLSYDWKNAVGVGAILGYNSIRCLDIDDCSDDSFIKDILEGLNLPIDYRWVIKSGSNNGYHIYVQSGVDLDIIEGKTLAYKANLRNEKTKTFKHIELRWRYHVVLPPSLHNSLNYYEFIFGMPYSPPIGIDFWKLRSFLSSNCSIDVYDNDGSTEYLSYVSDNKILIKDGKNYCPVKSNYNVLFFDTETSGLFKKMADGTLSYQDAPRLVQLSWTLCDNTKRIIQKASYIIKPRGFRISEEVARIHGITNDEAVDKGKDLFHVLKLFRDAIDETDIVVCHNYSFDTSIINYEEKLIFSIWFDKEKYGYKDPISWESIGKFCSMKDDKVILYCNLMRNGELKWPTLKELYFKLFGTDIKDWHNAADDVQNTMKCFWMLHDKNLITVTDYLK